jgi:hypothetical protein
LGDVQVAKAAPSRRHWNVACGEFEVNVKLGRVLASLAGGPVRIVVSGADTDQVQVAGVPSVPAEVTARTDTVWAPLTRLV